MIEIGIVPLSVNECWRGRRFKTDKYRDYEGRLLWLLPRMEIPDGPLCICFEFGFSSLASDWDNPVKPLQDILQKKYGFDDKRIIRAEVSKVLVKKGNEYLKFEIRKYEN